MVAREALRSGGTGLIAAEMKRYAAWGTGFIKFRPKKKKATPKGRPKVVVVSVQVFPR